MGRAGSGYRSFSRNSANSAGSKIGMGSKYATIRHHEFDDFFAGLSGPDEMNYRGPYAYNSGQ